MEAVVVAVDDGEDTTLAVVEGVVERVVEVVDEEEIEGEVGVVTVGAGKSDDVDAAVSIFNEEATVDVVLDKTDGEEVVFMGSLLEIDAERLAAVLNVEDASVEPTIEFTVALTAVCCVLCDVS